MIGEIVVAFRPLLLLLKTHDSSIWSRRELGRALEDLGELRSHRQSALGGGRGGMVFFLAAEMVVVEIVGRHVLFFSVSLR